MPGREGDGGDGGTDVHLLHEERTGVARPGTVCEPRDQGHHDDHRQGQ